MSYNGLVDIANDDGDLGSVTFMSDCFAHDCNVARFDTFLSFFLFSVLDFPHLYHDHLLT